MNKGRTGRWIIAVPMMALAVATVYPMLYALNVSLKSQRGYVLNPLGLTGSLDVRNFADAWTQADMGRYYLNSIVVTVASVAAILTIASMAGYALSHLAFRGRRATFLCILAAIMIPFQVTMVPLVKVLNNLHLLDTYVGLILAYTSQFLPFTIFFMTAYYSGIPKGITEAARVDGSGPFGVWARIMVPLGRPALMSMAILNALFCWNDILIALLIMQSPSHRTVMIGVSALPGEYLDNIPTYMAGVLLVVVPLVVVYIAFQRQITEGVTGGALKG